MTPIEQEHELARRIQVVNAENLALRDENKRLREELDKAQEREMELLWKLGTVNKPETKPEYDGGLYE